MKVFSYYFCLMIEGSGAGSGTGYSAGSVRYLVLMDPDPGGPKPQGRIRIRIRIPKTAFQEKMSLQCLWKFDNFFFFEHHARKTSGLTSYLQCRKTASLLVLAMSRMQVSTIFSVREMEWKGSSRLRIMILHLNSHTPLLTRN